LGGRKGKEWRVKTSLDIGGLRVKRLQLRRKQKEITNWQ
jgi:hypothetical protein